MTDSWVRLCFHVEQEEEQEEEEEEEEPPPKKSTSTLCMKLKFGM